MKVPQSTLELIKEFEGFRDESYRDIAGVWTIGWGTTRIYGEPVTRGMFVNAPVAEVFLKAQVKEFADDVTQLVTRELKPNQFDALVSLCYNIGVSGFSSSTLLREFNAGRPIRKDHFTRWNKVRVNGKLRVSSGLTARRNKEYDLFSKL